MVLKKYYGIEIECIYNTNLLHFNKGSYHEGVPISKHWLIEDDASIKTYLNKFKWSDDGEGCEFVSKKIDSKKKLINAIKEFKNLFSKNGKYELKEVLNFNSSSGLHIHLSVNKDNKEIRFKKIIDPIVFKKIRRRLLKDLKDSNIKSKNDIIANYFRAYAQKVKFDDNSNFRNPIERRLEYNFISESQNKGFEWRSPCLTNIETWKEFDFLINLYLKYANFMLKRQIKNKTLDGDAITQEDIIFTPKNEKIELDPEKKAHNRFIAQNKASPLDISPPQNRGVN
jgi:hypothetical protein